MKDNNTNGKVYGIGVGSGNPEDLTLKAVRILNECDGILVPAVPPEQSMAYQIALSTNPLWKEKPVYGFPFPMTKDAKIRDDAMKNVYNEIKGYLDEGQQLAFLTIGDVSIYSTFFYLKPYLDAGGYATEIVSGIPSFVAAAAVLGQSLCLDQEELHVVNSNSDYETALQLPGTKVFMKSGKSLADLKQVLMQHREYPMFAVKDCGMPTEEVFFTPEDIPVTYMVLVIVKAVES